MGLFSKFLNQPNRDKSEEFNLRACQLEGDDKMTLGQDH